MDVLEPLIRHGADLDRPTGSGLSPLQALASAQPGTLKVGAAADGMVQAGADLSATDDDGYTALTRAAEADRLSLLVALALGGADLNVPDPRGRRVVEILAGGTFQTPALGELLELGPVPTEAALDRARARNAETVVRVFEQALGR